MSRYGEIVMRRKTRRKYEKLFVGKRLRLAVRAYQAANGLPKKESVALEIGVTPSMLSQWSNGQSHPAEPEGMAAMQDLGIPTDELEHLMLLDKLDVWRNGISSDELVAMAKEVRQAERPRQQKGAVPAIG